MSIWARSRGRFVQWARDIERNGPQDSRSGAGSAHRASKSPRPATRWPAHPPYGTQLELIVSSSNKSQLSAKPFMPHAVLHILQLATRSAHCEMV